MKVLQIAEQRIQIENLYPYMEEYGKEYFISGEEYGPIDTRVVITREDIDFERRKSEQEDRTEGIPVCSFSDEYLEILAVYRKIAEWMPKQNTVLFHGSVVAVDQKGYLFTAKSGTGKSTHTRLWREMMKERAVMINDDKPLLKIKKKERTGEKEVRAYGTPWDGKHRLSTNCSVPLRGICILHRAESNRIQRIDKQRAYPVFLQQVYRPREKQSMERTLALLDEIFDLVPVYELFCNMELDAAKTAYEGMI